MVALDKARTVGLGFVLITSSTILCSCHCEYRHREFHQVTGNIFYDAGGQAGLDGLYRQYETFCERLAAEGFTWVSTTNTADKTKTVYSYLGPYDGVPGVKVTISLFKHVTTERSKLQIQVTSAETHDPHIRESGKRLIEKIKTWADQAR